MQRRGVWASVGLALLMLTPGAVLAQRGSDWYRDAAPWLGRRGEEGGRRVSLLDRYSRVRSDVRRAERRNEISGRDADHLYNRLDKVARFLRNDRHLSGSEYDHRVKDLDHIERDLDRATGYRVGRRDDWRR